MGGGGMQLSFGSRGNAIPTDFSRSICTRQFVSCEVCAFYIKLLPVLARLLHEN
jgi:hypothetical protein